TRFDNQFEHSFWVFVMLIYIFITPRNGKPAAGMKSLPAIHGYARLLFPVFCFPCSVIAKSLRLFIVLMNSTFLNRTALQSSSTATCRTASKPDFPSISQPWSLFISALYFLDVPFG